MATMGVCDMLPGNYSTLKTMQAMVAHTQLCVLLAAALTCEVLETLDCRLIGLSTLGLLLETIFLHTNFYRGFPLCRLQEQ